MTGHLETLPIVGSAINGLCDLGSNLLGGSQSDQLFAKTLSALSTSNPFSSHVAPGEMAGDMEAKLLELRALLEERVDKLKQQAKLLDMSGQLSEIARSLRQANLTRKEQEAIIAKIVAFLSSKDVAERMNTTAPDQGELLNEISKMLEQFDVSEPDRLPILQNIDDVLIQLEGKTAA